MEKEKIVFKILSILEKKHINLYHSITKKEILKFIDNQKEINAMSNEEFDLLMLKLFAFFKDAHTCYFIPYTPLNKKLLFLNEKFYVFINEQCLYLQLIRCFKR